MIVIEFPRRIADQLRLIEIEGRNHVAQLAIKYQREHERPTPLPADDGPEAA